MSWLSTSWIDWTEFRKPHVTNAFKGGIQFYLPYFPILSRWNFEVQLKWKNCKHWRLRDRFVKDSIYQAIWMPLWRIISPFSIHFELKYFVIMILSEIGEPRVGCVGEFATFGFLTFLVTMFNTLINLRKLLHICKLQKNKE